MNLRIGLVGDRSSGVRAHAAIPLALDLVRSEDGHTVVLTWIGTDDLDRSPERHLSNLQGIWCMPGSPYRSLEGALTAIRFAREQEIPFLGTCGGFQHLLLEYARNVLGLTAADHTESNRSCTEPLIDRLACSLAGTHGEVRFASGSRLERIYGTGHSLEEFNCSFGLNPRYLALFGTAALKMSAHDDAGAWRGVELDGHPFFIGTLFQPELSAFAGRPHPLVRAFLRATQGKM